MDIFASSDPLLLAPMAGVTDPVFRALCYGFGADLAFTEMVSAKGLFYKSEHTADLLLPSGKHPEGAQLFGHEPEILAAQIRSPYLEPFDVIDLNMGCPARKIISNGEGSALMRDPALAEAIMDACVKNTEKPVSVKMRLGWDTNTAHELISAAERTGIAFVTVHGRTTVQAYSGTADREALAMLKKHSRLPLIANGDIFDSASALDMRKKTRCDGLMIGRGAQGRPWIFAEIKAALRGKKFELSQKEKLEVARTHGLRLAALRGEKTAMLQMRKHLAWYTHGMRNAARLRGAMNAFETTEAFCSLIDELEKNG